MSRVAQDLGGVGSITTRILELEDAMDLIRESASRRWRWMGKVEGWDMREGVSGGRKIYYLNVRKHPLVCAPCPTYKPKQPP